MIFYRIFYLSIVHRIRLKKKKPHFYLFSRKRVFIAGNYRRDVPKRDQVKLIHIEFFEFRRAKYCRLCRNKPLRVDFCKHFRSSSRPSYKYEIYNRIASEVYASVPICIDPTVNGNVSFCVFANNRGVGEVLVWLEINLRVNSLCYILGDFLLRIVFMSSQKRLV